jgi:hypothetical protein
MVSATSWRKLNVHLWHISVCLASAMRFTADIGESNVAACTKEVKPET